MSKTSIGVCAILLIASLAFAQSSRYESPLGVQVAPGLDIPLGDSTSYFEPGFTTGIALRITPESLETFNLAAGLDYLQNPRAGLEEQLLYRISLTAGGGVRLPLFNWLAFRVDLGGGYSFSRMDHDDGPLTAGIPVVKASAGPSFGFLPWMDMDVAVAYQGYLGLSNTLSLSLGLTYRFEKRAFQQGPPVLKGLPPKIINLQFDEIFPVFYSYYDNHPAGSALLLNPREDEITDITLDFYVKQYMDAPKRCRAPESLAPGETGDVDIIALFNNSVLSVTEGTKVAAELTLSYKVDGVTYTDTYSETMRMQYRNAMTWDDDRRAAAFVTAKDPAIMSFAKNVASMLHGRESTAIDRNFQRAVAIHNALSLYGMTYVIDPTTSYAELSETETAIDFLQFPRETLEYKAGDCDDLSILHSALFEALGMETAFITVPGHIFIAFGLDITPNEAARMFSNRDSLIIREDTVWLPLEITALEESFLKAWDLGARQWNEHEPEGRADFYPVRAAWEQYEPVGLPGEVTGIPMPMPARVVERFERDLETFINRQMEPLEKKLKDEIRRKQGDARSYNKLGVLYGRYGLLEKAVAEFERALERGDYAPALINLGNISFLQEDMEGALEYYKRAEQLRPGNSKVLLSLARTEHALGNRQEASRYYQKLTEQQPELAARFSYLDSGREDNTRASDANNTKHIVVWDEEPGEVE